MKQQIWKKSVSTRPPIATGEASPRLQVTPKPTATPRVPTIEGWKVYQNAKAGVSFEYPGDWMIKEYDYQSPENEIPENPFIISVSPKYDYNEEDGVEIPDTYPSFKISTSSLSYIESLERDLFHNGVDVSERFVDNKTGYSYDLSRELYEKPRPYRIGRVIVVPLNTERTRTASIGIFGEQQSAKETYSPEAKKNLELLEKMVSTVKFE